MAIHVERNPIQHLTTYTVTGKINVTDFMDEVVKFYEGQPTEYVLWNLLDADLWSVNAKDAETISNFPMRYNPGINRKKTAVVAGDEHAYDLTTWFKKYGEMDDLPFKVQIFTSLADAFTWLEC